MELPRTFEEFDERLTSTRRAADWLSHLYPNDRRLASIGQQLGHLANWTQAGLQPSRSQRALFNLHSLATSVLDRSDFELAMSCSLLIRSLETWGLDLPAESLRMVQRVAGAPDADELRAICEDESLIEPAVWRLAARYGSAFDLRLVEELLLRDPVTAPHLLDNPTVPDGTIRTVVAWAAGHLALRPSSMDAVLNAGLVLRGVAPMLSASDPVVFALFAALLNATQPADAWRRRVLFDVVIRVRKLEPHWLAELVPLVTDDGPEVLRSLVWHPAATTEFWRGVLEAADDAAIATAVIPVIAARRKVSVDDVLGEFDLPRAALASAPAGTDPKCPRCRVAVARPYLYGDLTPEQLERCRRGEAKMGGVRITLSAPEWFCSICEHSWNVVAARRDEQRGLWALDPAKDVPHLGAGV
jgi:hypothetical protein